jgi:DNA-binding transcriptional MerR regulator/effector-binding domain-containing protein
MPCGCILYEVPMPLSYTIKEFESLTGISSHNLRYFDKIDLLKPYRDNNGYRMYSLPQVAIAEMITILQKAKVPNAEIRVLLNNYASKDTINRLKKSQLALHQYIEELTLASESLTKHINSLENIDEIKRCLNKPFIDARDEISVGSVSLKTENILDFFNTVGHASENNSWYLIYNYGFVLNSSEITKEGYPLVTFYCDTPEMISQAPYILHSGRYMSCYCSGSLENNVRVYELIAHVRQKGYQITGPILIENVSGPAVETDKKDFIIKIMIPIEA